MLNLMLRRVFIVIALLSFLVGLSAMSENSLLMSLPTELDIIHALLAKQVQEEKILEAKNEYLSQQYVKLLEEREYLEELEKERIKAEQNRIKWAYTLGDRDKPADYQKLFDHTVEHTFIVHFTQGEFDGLVDDMIDYHQQFGNYRSNNYRKVDVTYRADDEEFKIRDVGIRSKGNIFSRYPPIDNHGNVIPIHYMLKFNETFDTVPGSQGYDWLKKREVFDVEKLYFKWNRVNDQTYINELYSLEVFERAGVVVPEITLTRFIIEIDGVVVREDLYTVQEVIDEEFIRKNLQETPTKEVGDLYKVIWPGTLEPIPDSSWYGVRDWTINYRPTYGKETNQDILNFNNIINFSVALNFEDLEQRKIYLQNNLDIDSLIMATAVNVFLGNPDDYRGNANNYYLYFDEESYVTYIPFDYDNSMGVGWNGAPVFIDWTLGNDIYTWQGNGFNSHTDAAPLVENLLEFEEYRILYENYLEQIIVDEHFSYDTFSTLFDTLESIYGDDFDMINDKEYYINTKIANVLDDIEYYRNLRNE